jgi:hypothetical protein
MSKKVLTTTLAAIACAAVVVAQEPQTPQAPAPPAQAPAVVPQAPDAQPPAAAPRAPDARSVPTDNLTVMGCLERRAPGAVGTAGGAGNADSPGFILTKAMKPPAAAGGSSSAATAAASYRLDADDKKLAEHVGQKVEITGTVADRSADANASKGGDMPRLKVDSVKMIAATCTE